MRSKYRRKSSFRKGRNPFERQLFCRFSLPLPTLLFRGAVCAFLARGVRFALVAVVEVCGEAAVASCALGAACAAFSEVEVACAFSAPI